MAISGELGVTKYFGDDSGRYVHDDGNIHETNIESIASEGVTKGCDRPYNDGFCRLDHATRGRMTVLMARTLSHGH